MNVQGPVVTWKADLPEGLNVVGTVSSSGEIRQVELNLIPSLIESHWHGADEWLDTSGRLIVGGSETTTDVLVIEYLHFESEILLQLYANKIGELDLCHDGSSHLRS